ncbi:hypothetical protein BGZ49_006384, partial [Haplosporangium sp. Z 27]
MQTSFLGGLAKNISECMQTDSIHAFIKPGDFSEVNVTFTSTYCPIIKRTIPIIISILFGKSSTHYERHFYVLLQSLQFETWEIFQAEFPGMTCDFSDAERAGFESAILRFYGIPISEYLDEMERYYRF